MTDKEIKKIMKNVGHLVDLWLPMKIKYDKTPGLSLGLVYKGELVYTRGFGFADQEKKIRADKNTLYHIASISKTFTAVAVMQLVEKGTLHLEDKVADYIPWFKAKKEYKDTKNITIRQLLSHTAGIFRDGDTPHWETGEFPSDLKKSFSADSLSIENATGFKYTNYGFSLLGMVIEKVTGMTYDKYVQTHVFEPLGLSATFPDYSETITNIATGYGREIPDEARRVFGHYKTNAYASATGFISNVSDLAKYIAALTLDSSKKSSKKILDRESKKELFRPHEKTEDGDEYGLGFDITLITKRKIVGHSGGFCGFVTQVLFDPESSIGVIVLTNTQSSACSIARGIFEAIHTGIDNSKNSSEKIKSYTAYEGLYRNTWGDTVIAQFGKNLLSFSPVSNNPLRFATNFKPDTKAHRFAMHMEGVFGPHHEFAQFKDFVSGKPQTLIFGAGPLKRLDKKRYE